MSARAMAAAAALALTCVSAAHDADPAGKGAETGVGRITGIGGVFLRSKDPKALRAWYRDVLGLKIEAWGGAALRYDDPQHPQVVVWNVLPQTTDYMAPSTREMMLDFAVDDLDAIIARIKAKGGTILKQDDSDPDGRFAWLLDPDGTKIELWQPKRPTTAAAR